MKIKDEFIEQRANEYVKCIIKPMPTFEQYLHYTWSIYEKFRRNKIYN
jgi:hypothetical protein